MTEEWRDVAGYGGRYQVSNLGRVRSLNRTIVQSNGKTQARRGRLLKPRPTKAGYRQVHLYEEGAGANQYIHRLVLDAFVGSAPDGTECNHKDGDKTNNHVDNLEWVSHTENIRHAYDNGLCGAAKLSPEIAEMIRKVYALGQHTQEQIGQMFGINQQMTSNIVRGESWR